MKKITLVGRAVLAGTIALSGVASIASANEMHQTSTSTYQQKVDALNHLKSKKQISNNEYQKRMEALKEYDKHGRTNMGMRPYGGFPPKGMTNHQYVELEKKVDNDYTMSTKEFEKKSIKKHKILQINMA